MAIAVDGAGNVVVALGDSLSLLGAAEGRLLWTTPLPLTISAVGVRVLADGTIVEIGTVDGTSVFGATTIAPPAATGTDGFLARFDAGGALLSAASLADVDPLGVEPLAALVDATGAPVVVGRTPMAPGGGSYAWLGGAMHAVSRSIALEGPLFVDAGLMAGAPGPFALGGDGSPIVPQFDPSTGVRSVVKIADDGSTLRTFAPLVAPESTLPSSVVAFTRVGADGSSSAVAWIDTLWAIDGVGAGVPIVTQGAVEQALAEAFGTDACTVDERGDVAVVVQDAHTIFVVGSAVVNTGEPLAGFWPRFVAKIER